MGVRAGRRFERVDPEGRILHGIERQAHDLPATRAKHRRTEHLSFPREMHCSVCHPEFVRQQPVDLAMRKIVSSRDAFQLLHPSRPGSPYIALFVISNDDQPTRTWGLHPDSELGMDATVPRRSAGCRVDILRARGEGAAERSEGLLSLSCAPRSYEGAQRRISRQALDGREPGGAGEHLDPPPTQYPERLLRTPTIHFNCTLGRDLCGSYAAHRQNTSRMLRITVHYV